MLTYPEKIKQRLANLTRCRTLQNATAEGSGVNLACGSAVRFFLCIDENGRILDAAFRSNGCGHTRAAADVLAGFLSEKRLVDLDGLSEQDLRDRLDHSLGMIAPERHACVGSAIDAVRAAFADNRRRRIEEFHGEKALVCTCFSVTEERIEQIITESGMTSVDQVTAVCNAGAGCGSCRMLIQEIFDAVL